MGKIVKQRQREKNRSIFGRIALIDILFGFDYFFVLSIQQPKSDARARVTLVGLFPLHQGPNCDQIVSVKNYYGFQRMEAFILALNVLNNKRLTQDSQLFVEAILYDTCSDQLAEHVNITTYIHRTKRTLDKKPVL